MVAEEASLPNGNANADTMQLDKDTNAMAVDENDEGPAPRLLIKKMVLENFKSYAGVKEIGPFHKCFSSVVGPNGSGKSNVIDAMLFVFGKRAKKLRLNKVSELIHNSAAVKHSPPPFARVSVHFHEIVDTGEGDDDYKVIPNSERVVTRIARQDSSSTYKLDGKNCAFKDVAKYLDSKGIDLDNNRFLILQGEVELISMMQPKGKTENDEGLLEYLEDIIGSNKYVEETNEAAAKVDLLSEQRQEKLNRVKAVEKEKDNLEGAKMEAEALLGKEREIRRKKNILYQINDMLTMKDKQRFEEEKATVDTELETERQRLKSADERVQEIEGGLSEQRSEYDTIHKELKQTKEQFTAYERRDIKLREEIKHLKAEKKKLDSKLKSENKKETDAIAKGQDAEGSIPGLEEKIMELTKAKNKGDEKLEAIFEDMKGVTDKLRVGLEEKTQELAPVAQERAVFQANLDTAETEVKLLEDSTTRAREQLASAEKELSSLDSTQGSKRDVLASCEDELADAKQRIVVAETEEQDLAKSEGLLANRNKELVSQIEEAKAAMQSSGAARSQAVSGILKAAQKGGELSKVGVLGRLGDLATVTDEYDVAVSTASGMLDNIVVQTTAGAQRCLEFLRKYGLGRASFIPLDKMKKGAHDRPVDTPESAPRLFDLITPKNHAVTPALFLAVHNTLVAPDLETATRWAYDYGKRWRVVTVDGNLIETAGTMSGGGRNVRRGGMRLSNSKSISSSSSTEDVSAHDCKKLEKEASDGQALLTECRKRRSELRDEVRTLKKRVKTLTVKLPKLTMEIAGCDTTREELTKRLPELRSQCELSAGDATTISNLNKKVHKCKSDMASCAMLASKLEADVARLQKAILDAGGSKLKKQQAACEKALASLSDTEKALNSAKVVITTCQKSVAKTQKAQVAAEKDLETAKATLEEKQTEFKSLEAEAFEVMQAYEKVKEVEASKREALEAVSKECEELRKCQAKVKFVEIELLGKVETYEKQIGECTKRCKHWENEILKLREAAEEDDDYNDSDDEAEEEDNPSKENDMSCEGDDVEMKEADNAPTESTNSESEKTASGRVSLPSLPHASLEQYRTDELKNDIGVLEEEHKSLGKNANMGAITEYRKKEADYLARVLELDEVSEERNSARKTHEELRRLRLEKFMDGFGQITLKLKEMYQMITLGGDAELELVDSLDPFSEGIVFSVRPPKKSWKNIANLSGGEKTLSSLALVFALHHYKPTPLYVMDEIDAALDFKNVSIVANYIKERTKNAQFIIISLRNNMFELADRLVGIYKTNDCTKSVTIDPRTFGVTNQQNGAAPVPLSDKTNADAPSTTGKDSSRRETFLENQENSMVVDSA